MKKRFKKITVGMAAAALAMSMALPTMAAGTITSQDDKDSGRKYDVYQIFTGEYDSKNSELSHIMWGDDAKIPTGAKKGDLVSIEVLDELTKANGKTEREILSVVEKYANFDDTNLYGSLSAGGTLNNVQDGYYLLRDVNDKESGEAKVVSTYIVEVVGGAVTVKAKTATPKVDKQVLDEDGDQTTNDQQIATNNTDEANNNKWSESADHSIGEVFSFRLLAQLPDDKNIDAYKQYKLKFTDTLSKGISFDKMVSVKYSTDGGTTWNDNQVISAYDTANQNGYRFSGFETQTNGTQIMTLTIDDLKKTLPDNVKLQNLQIEVVYKAHLNEDAKVTSVVSGDDSNQNKVKLEYSRNPNYEGDGDNTPTDETEEDTVFVFTYDVDNFKTKEDGKTALPDAQFSLFVADIENKAGSEIEMVVDSAKEDGSEVVYRPATSEDKKKLNYSAATITSPAGGKIKFKGLDAGSYVLRETKAPGNYKEAADMLIMISAEHKEKNNETAQAEVAKLSRTVNQEPFTENKIINKKGSNLPETGGMGTTVLYTIGGLMVLGAGATLAAKKRVSK